MTTPCVSLCSASKANLPYGALALRYAGKRLPLQVLYSTDGYYIGTADDECPISGNPSSTSPDAT